MCLRTFLTGKLFQDSNVAELKTRDEHLNFANIKVFMVHKLAKTVTEDKIRLVPNISMKASSFSVWLVHS